MLYDLRIYLYVIILYIVILYHIIYCCIVVFVLFPSELQRCNRPKHYLLLHCCICVVSIRAAALQPTKTLSIVALLYLYCFHQSCSVATDQNIIYCCIVVFVLFPSELQRCNRPKQRVHLHKYCRGADGPHRPGSNQIDLLGGNSKHTTLSNRRRLYDYLPAKFRLVETTCVPACVNVCPLHCGLFRVRNTS